MTARVTKAALTSYVRYAREGRVVVFDTETTGLGPRDEIVQIAAAEYVCGELTRTMCVLSIPSCPIHPAAEAVHGLSREYLMANGVSQTEALGRFFDFLGDDVLLVAHNIFFDYRMLNATCVKNDFTANPTQVKFCDTIALAKKLVPGLERYKLSHLIEALGLSGVNSHDALDDALACGELFFRLIERIRDK